MEISDNTWQEMFRVAFDASSVAFAPISRFGVGAALLSGRGKIYAGCNVEDTAFTSSLHAEQSAVGHLVLAERQVARIDAIVVVAGSRKGWLAPVPPCGHCRQFMNEFIGNERDVPVRSYNERGQLTGEFKFRQLLPHSFSGSDFLPH